MHQKWFEILSSPLTISGAEYCLDADPGSGNATPLSPNDGAFDVSSEAVHNSIDTASLTEGAHTLYVRARSSDSRWSGAVGRDITVGLPAPHITSLSHASGIIGTIVTITGDSFGAAQGTSTVTFNNTPATAVSWSDTAIQITVPEGASSGPVVVTVNGVASNADQLFSVLFGAWPKQYYLGWLRQDIASLANILPVVLNLRWSVPLPAPG